MSPCPSPPLLSDFQSTHTRTHRTHTHSPHTHAHTRTTAHTHAHPIQSTAGERVRRRGKNQTKTADTRNSKPSVLQPVRFLFLFLFLCRVVSCRVVGVSCVVLCVVCISGNHVGVVLLCICGLISRPWVCVFRAAVAPQPVPLTVPGLPTNWVCNLIVPTFLCPPSANGGAAPTLRPPAPGASTLFASLFS